jgi:hypothetical protein
MKPKLRRDKKKKAGKHNLQEGEKMSKVSKIEIDGVKFIKGNTITDDIQLTDEERLGLLKKLGGVDKSEEQVKSGDRLLTPDSAPKKGGRIWIPEYEEEYHMPYDDGVATVIWKGDSHDYKLLATGAVFRTEEEAKKCGEKLEALYKIKRYIAENFEAWTPDWEDANESKWCIHYNWFYNILDYCVDYKMQRTSELPILKSKEEAREIIDKFSNELRMIFGVGEDD